MTRDDPGRDGPAKTDAALDPWLTVGGEGQVRLFGFALRHPATGGLAWTVSTVVVELDADAGRAATASGRRYALGQRLSSPAELPDEEARVAYALLVCPVLGADPAVLLGGRDYRRSGLWVTARKAARHLGLPPPGWCGDELERFMQAHLADYAAKMRRGLGR